ncbi:hypothetical protein ACT29H_06790 [Thermophagus sp. OGC60D27]
MRFRTTYRLNSLLIKPVDVHRLLRGDRLNMMKPRNLINQFVAGNTGPPT